MVLNLLDNAIRHTPAGLEIELRLRAEAPPRVIEVADDGPGIPAEQRDADLRALRPRRGPCRHGRQRAGSGLGLAIVRAVATSHAGTVEVADSPRGRGALPHPHAAGQG